MHRTTILLSPELRRDAEAAARQRGISLSEMIRRLLAAAVRGNKPGSRQADPLFRPRRLMARGNPANIARNHDLYLYGPPSERRKR